MNERKPKPGVSRPDRVSDEGLERLRLQLERGVRISQPVLAQWVKRYGDAARELIEQAGYQLPE